LTYDGALSYRTIQWRSKEGGKWGHAPRGADLGGASTRFFSHYYAWKSVLLKNVLLCRNLNQNVP